MKSTIKLSVVKPPCYFLVHKIGSPLLHKVAIYKTQEENKKREENVLENIGLQSRAERVVLICKYGGKATWKAKKNHSVNNFDEVFLKTLQLMCGLAIVWFRRHLIKKQRNKKLSLTAWDLREMKNLSFLCLLQKRKRKKSRLAYSRPESARRTSPLCNFVGVNGILLCLQTQKYKPWLFTLKVKLWD